MLEEDFGCLSMNVLKLPKFEFRLKSLNLTAHFTQVTEIRSIVAGKHFV